VRDLGYVEGQNVVIESRYAEGQLTRLPTLAAELVHLAPDVLWTHSTEATQAAKQATTTIPIVIGVENNMVEEGFVANLARPGGNLTGMELRAIELTGKRLQLLKEAVPTITRVAVLVNPTLSGHERVPGNIEAEARALGVQLQRVEAGGPDTFEAASPPWPKPVLMRCSSWKTRYLPGTATGSWTSRACTGCRPCLAGGTLPRRAVCYPMGRTCVSSASAPPCW